ncbi:cyclopropane fatty acyl phospholipid synthase [Cesiribacter andamanensis]|uniref:Cyclopropane-fatty-acyl-phospholipid synthase n=1 Tax=Cesiribacter andamanensis AMV16 TaxID=1279009 RepID=M7NSX1_9BACT|nr:cyclopropane fatty acyl phospholipid synthase [Cesiribacter andamanensis]EMR04760.1 Cyclopropane-fatty-acyl-phospholipid synthase [Cesiribacter andamanensis AMV16]
MSTARLRQHVADILSLADIEINGPDPWDLQIHNPAFYKRVLQQGTLGLGESYMEGWWDCQQLDEFFYRALRADLYKRARLSWRGKLDVLLARISNRQTKQKAVENIHRHYDIGNRLYQRMLDRRMTYTCGYWKEATSLDQAQEDKMDLICRKIGLQPGQRVLDIGCGWGSFAKFAAERYGAEVVGITISHEQLALGRQLCEGLPIELRFQDYRDIHEPFDHIVSIGMAEAVGHRNMRTYMQVAARCLHNEGFFLLHTIGHPFSKTAPDPFIDTYIFPNCLIPSLKQLSRAMEHLFIVEDLHNFGPHYDPTLMAWHRNFTSHWQELKQEYDERFYRMWTYYLLSSAGSFRARNNQLWQLVLSKKGVLGGYTSIR